MGGNIDLFGWKKERTTEEPLWNWPWPSWMDQKTIRKIFVSVYIFGLSPKCYCSFVQPFKGRRQFKIIIRQKLLKTNYFWSHQKCQFWNTFWHSSSFWNWVREMERKLHYLNFVSQIVFCNNFRKSEIPILNAFFAGNLVMEKQLFSPYIYFRYTFFVKSQHS